MKRKNTKDGMVYFIPDDVHEGTDEHPQCTFFELFASSPDPECADFGEKFCHMNGGGPEKARQCNGDYLKCPLAWGR
jgi:hypothetical protein